MTRNRAQDQREFLAACEGSSILARRLWDQAKGDYQQALTLLSDHNLNEDNRHNERPF